MKPAIFLDRDGVVIENRANYVRSWADVEIFPAAVQALVQIASSAYQIIFVTNQSAVGRGIISFETAAAINQKLIAKLEKNGCRVNGVYMCPHAPDDECGCRKPQPGLLQQATQELSLDLSHSIMIGDAWTDLQAGAAAGVAEVALLRTGRGVQQLRLPTPPGLADAPVYDTLAEALAAFMDK